MPVSSVEAPTISFFSGVITPEKEDSAAIETIPVVPFTEIPVAGGGETAPEESTTEISVICPVPFIDPFPLSQKWEPPL